MKIMFTKVSIIILLILTYSCKKDDANEIIRNDTSYLKAKINDENFSSSLEIVAFKAGGKTYLTTADNHDLFNEYEFTWIIDNFSSNDPTKKRYGFVELKDYNNRDNNLKWKLPNNFNFNITNETDAYIEGTFSFIAPPSRFPSDAPNDLTLVFTDGTFRANKKSY